jgi:hypothetical protein
MVNRGEVVVICVANVVFWPSVFWGAKNTPAFELYF